MERRRKPRITCAYPAIVRDLENRFEERATLCNLSAGGLYLRLNRVVEPGCQLWVVIHLAAEPTEQTATLAVRGIVVRSETQPDGQWGVALKVDRYHFL